MFSPPPPPLRNVHCFILTFYNLLLALCIVYRLHQKQLFWHLYDEDELYSVWHAQVSCVVFAWYIFMHLIHILPSKWWNVKNKHERSESAKNLELYDIIILSWLLCFLIKNATFDVCQRWTLCTLKYYVPKNSKASLFKNIIGMLLTKRYTGLSFNFDPSLIISPPPPI